MSTQTIAKAVPQAGVRTKSRTRKLEGRSRKGFLKLPMVQRRRILKSQALAASSHYAKDTDWRAWEAADLTSA